MKKKKAPPHALPRLPQQEELLKFIPMKYKEPDSVAPDMFDVPETGAQAANDEFRDIKRTLESFTFDAVGLAAIRARMDKEFKRVPSLAKRMRWPQ